MSKSIISLILLCCLNAAAQATELQLQENLPERYTVLKGDTLWDISSRYLKDPWRWPELWQINKEEVKNPHLIYPGDVLVLDLSGKTPSLRLLRGVKSDNAKSETPAVSETLATEESALEAKNVSRLNPHLRVEPHAAQAIPTIPLSVIGPFLTRPLVINEAALEKGPRIAIAQESRVVLGAGNLAYVRGIKEGQGNYWQIFRPGKTLIDPETQKILGYEAIYLGDARVKQFGSPSTVEIAKSIQEIGIGDYLVTATEDYPTSYTPHAPSTAIKGRIMSAYGTTNVAELAPNAVVTINRGRLSGIEDGQVLAIYRSGETVNTAEGKLKLPDERYGLLLVFRTFDKVAYGLIMQSTRPVHVLDIVQNP